MVNLQTLSMTEKLLQFIWQFRHFNQHPLHLESGEQVLILSTGFLNSNQGPDFLQGRIKIEDTIWIGNIELHLKSSDWKKHAHETDSNYTNVILHVVWEYDSPIPEKNIPTLVLQQNVPKVLLEKYKEWMESPSVIPCKKNISQVNELVWISWKERMLAERLERKSIRIKECLNQNNEHWEETLWWQIAGNFGMKINTSAFEAIARSLPIQILAKHKNQIHQIEALLFGQAGLLAPNNREAYPKMLFKEYQFLNRKYHLAPVYEPVHFLRMRPGNFPTIRLAQLAMLIHMSSHLFSKFKEIKTTAEICQLLTVTANDYWHQHYVFDEISSFKKKTLGRQMTDNIIINTIVPIMFCYGSLHADENCKTKALNWLAETATEQNAIIDSWKQIDILPENAFDSQALLELRTQYCDEKKCLECAIGNNLLKKANLPGE